MKLYSELRPGDCLHYSDIKRAPTVWILLDRRIVCVVGGNHVVEHTYLRVCHPFGEETQRTMYHASSAVDYDGLIVTGSR